MEICSVTLQTNGSQSSWYSLYLVKGIVSDSNNNIFHDMNQMIPTKKKEKKNHLIHLQVMHDYVHWYFSIDYCVRLILVNGALHENWFISHWNNFCLISLGKCASWTRAIQIDAKNLNFEIFESTLYMESGSMPSIVKFGQSIFSYSTFDFDDVGS